MNTNLKKYGQYLILSFIGIIPFLYDTSVVEASADTRWMLLHGLSIILPIGLLVSLLSEIRITYIKPPITIVLSACILVYALLSLLWAINPHLALWGFKHLSAYITLSFFIYLLKDIKWYCCLIWLIVIGTSFNCILGILQYHGISDGVVIDVFPFWKHITHSFSSMMYYIHRLIGADVEVIETLSFRKHDMFINYFTAAVPPAATLGNKNLLGSYLVTVIPVIIYLVLASRRMIAKIMAIIILLLSIYTLIIVDSRASILSLVLATIVLSIVVMLNSTIRNGIRKRISRYTVMVILLVSILTGLFIYNNRIDLRDKWVALFNKDMTANLTVGIRAAYGLNGLAIVRDNPLGTGLNTFAIIYPKYYKAIYPTDIQGFSEIARPTRMHNDWIQTLVELGIPGILLYAALFIYLFRMVIYLRRPNLMSLCLLYGVVCLLFNAFMDFPLQLVLSPMLLWIYIGMISGLYVTNIECKTIKPNKLIIPILLIAGICYGMFIISNDVLKRKSDQYLRLCILHIASEGFNDNALAMLEKSMGYYTDNYRLQEYRALMYANYKGSRNIDIDERISHLEAVVSHDPYYPHHLVNLCALYTGKSVACIKSNDKYSAKYYLQKAQLKQNILTNYPHIFPTKVEQIGMTIDILNTALCNKL